jgi:hypothetical protein
MLNFIVAVNDNQGKAVSAPCSGPAVNPGVDNAPRCGDG